MLSNSFWKTYGKLLPLHIFHSHYENAVIVDRNPLPSVGQGRGEGAEVTPSGLIPTCTIWSYCYRSLPSLILRLTLYCTCITTDHTRAKELGDGGGGGGGEGGEGYACTKREGLGTRLALPSLFQLVVTKTLVMIVESYVHCRMCLVD